MKDKRVTVTNYKMVTRGQTIRMETAGGGYVTIERKSLYQFLDLYRNEYDVVLSMHVNNRCYLTTVAKNTGEAEAELSGNGDQLELPFE